MLSSTVKLLCLVLALPSFLSRSEAQRQQQIDAVRGNSFGLENFLFQPYDSPEVREPVRVVKAKRVRPAASPRLPPPPDRAHALESLGVPPYESSRVTPDHPKRRIPEPTQESVRIKENFIVKPEPEGTQEPEIQETGTERIRKRITMRRRRKRPQNAAQSDGEATESSILKPVRIPAVADVPKVAIRTKLPNHIHRQQPVSAKPTVPPQTENAETEREQPTTAVPEKPTAPTTTEKPSPINLKAFLKQQTETLSLSELLQTQNLSLADLLRGNKDASAILKARQGTTTTAATTVRRKQVDRIEEPPQKIEVFEITTSRASYNGFQPKIPRTKVGDHAAGHPPGDTHEDLAKPVRRPPSTSEPLDPLTKLNELRLKLRNFQKKTNPPARQEATRPPPERDETVPESAPAEPKTTETPQHKKNRISFKSTNNPELSLILPSKVKPEPETWKRPERLTNWTSRLPSTKRIAPDRLKQNDVLSKPVRIPVLIEEEAKSAESEEEQSTTPEVVEAHEEDYRKPEAKDELIELLKSGQNADRLQKILQSRNMTIQELLDNREKPPLQVDISTLFSSQRKPLGSTQPTLFDSLPDFETQDAHPDAVAYEEPEPEESAPVIARVQLMNDREPKKYEFPGPEKGATQLNLRPDDLATDTSNAEHSALWKLSEKSIYYGSSYGYGDFGVSQQTEKAKTPSTPKTSDLTEEDIILLETIRRNQETNRKFKLDLKDFAKEEEQPEAEDIEMSYIPPAVKSAIIASGVVMGIALFVFIAIFAACGWKQRQIRLKGSSGGGLGGTLTKRDIKSKRTLSPVSFKDAHSYKKTIDFEDETSESGTSNTSSYLWSTLKNTFTSRASTLKSRLEKEEKLREDKVTLRRNESRRKESRLDDRQIGEEIYAVKRIDRDRNVINTSFNFKRSPSNSNVNHFNECVHGY